MRDPHGISHFNKAKQSKTSTSQTIDIPPFLNASASRHKPVVRLILSRWEWRILTAEARCAFMRCEGSWLYLRASAVVYPSPNYARRLEHLKMGIGTRESAIAIGFTFPIIGASLIALRFYIRWHQKSSVGIDDWLCLPSWVSGKKIQDKTYMIKSSLAVPDWLLCVPSDRYNAPLSGCWLMWCLS